MTFHQRQYASTWGALFTVSSAYNVLIVKCMWAALLFADVAILIALLLNSEED